MLIEAGRQLDCRLDARASEGRLIKYYWELEVREKIRNERTEVTYSEIDTTCKFVEDATSSTDSNGKYVNMSVRLEVEDRDGTRSNPVTRTIKLYTSGNCGF